MMKAKSSLNKLRYGWQVMDRLASAEATVDLTSIRKGQLSVDEWVRMQRLISGQEGMPLTIVDEKDISIAKIRTHLNRIKREAGGKLSAIGVDYLQIMGGLMASTRLIISVKSLAP